MSNIIKASDVSGDNHDAVEMNQLQDSTETKENQVPNYAIERLAAIMWELTLFEKVSGVRSVDLEKREIWLGLPQFLDTFPTHVEEKGHYQGKYDRLSVKERGVTFFAMRKSKENELEVL